MLIGQLLVKEFHRTKHGHAWIDMVVSATHAKAGLSACTPLRRPKSRLCVPLPPCSLDATPMSWGSSYVPSPTLVAALLHVGIDAPRAILPHQRELRRQVHPHGIFYLRSFIVLNMCSKFIDFKIQNLKFLNDLKCLHS
jgi:hypothetical protein